MIDRVKKYPQTLAFALYFLFSVALTWPLLFKLNSVLFGDFGDSRGAVSWIWLKANGYLQGPLNMMTAAPFGAPVNQSFSQPVLEWILLALARVFNEVIAYNLFIFISFPLTAYCMFIFLNWLLKDRKAAFFGGVVFGFCPGAVMQATGGHAAFAFNMFIPLFMMSLFYNLKERSYKSEFFVALSFSLIAFTSLYFGYFACYMLLFFFIFDYFQGIPAKPNAESKLQERGRHRPAILRSYLCIAGFIGLLILPFVYKAIVQQFTMSTEDLKKAVRIRDVYELTVYSARFWDYLLPSVDHPLFGRLIYRVVRANLHGSNIPEQTLFLGWTTLGLIIAGMRLNFKKLLELRDKYFYSFFGIGALLMFYLSLEPVLRLGRLKIPTWSYFAYDLVPMFRVYARAGIVVAFFVAAAAAVVLRHYRKNISSRSYNQIYFVLLMVLLFEFWSVPPNYARPIDRPPEVYSWLAAQPDGGPIAIFPMAANDDFSFYTYTFWQRLHHKKLINGASRDNEKAWELFEKIKDISDPSSVERLRSLNVKYVIIHEKIYEEGIIPDAIKRYFPLDTVAVMHGRGHMPALPISLKLVQSFGTDRVYSIEAGESGL
jgi:hypothetical protein